MLWDKTIIMQNGEVRANVSRSEIEGQGKTLEELFFEVTEGLEPSSVRATAEEEAQANDAASDADSKGEPEK